ncbi:carbohydrate-binding protein [Chitinolyticbacter albus]|uniref:carbohydrate-binding protein n=1 Tax=Chitinolyticbacter albus TaxID=2961951 RepID=UPI0027E4FE3C|nr:carbohydrate-binding protein [Chitinolyticbacter albus]
MHIVTLRYPVTAFALAGLALATGQAHSAGCEAPWQEGSTYAAGQVASYIDHNYAALVTHIAYVGANWNPASTPTLWRDLGPCVSVSTTPTPISPTPVTPSPVTPPPVSPTPVTPSPTTPTPITATPLPTTVPTPVTPASVTPTPPAGCQVAPWNPTTAYLAGERVSVGNTVYQAKWWTQGNDPTLSEPWGPWSVVSECTYVPTEPPGTDKLVISEIAASNHPAEGAWVELHNTGDTPYDLSGAVLRTRRTYNCLPPCPVNQYTLPAGTRIVAGGFLVISATYDPNPVSSATLRYVSDPLQYPSWGNAGFVELVSSNGRTIDFIRFGDDTAQPATSSAWAGSNISALPTGRPALGMALVRPFPLQPDSNSAGDWRLVPFSTPGGVNDVAADAIDSDNDGIPNWAKHPGGSYGGIDFYALGARAGRRDIFVQLDWMPSNDPGTTPRKEALDNVVAAFARRGIALHFDAGPLFSASFNPALYNLGGGRALPYQPCISMNSTTSAECPSIYEYKMGMDVRRRQSFHYLVFGGSQSLDGSGGSSGRAELPGNDLIVTLGGWRLSTDTPTDLQILINYQAGTIMHELGHNFGLFHGGNDGANNEPNYLSVMNYLYQLTGVGNDAKTDEAVQRWYANHGIGGYNGYCALANGPCSNTMNIDYSDGSGAALNEGALKESDLLGRGAYAGVYADWNDNKLADAASYALDLGADGGSPLLTDYNDWANVMLPFSRNGDVLNGQQPDDASAPQTAVPNAVQHDTQPLSDEAPPASWLIPAKR